jgi:hypothetical protein
VYRSTVNECLFCNERFFPKVIIVLLLRSCILVSMTLSYYYDLCYRNSYGIVSNYTRDLDKYHARGVIGRHFIIRNCN